MVTYYVHMTNVAAVAEEMGAIAKQIQGMLEDMDQSAASTLANWTSSAREAYDVAHVKWTAAAQQMAAQAAAAEASLGQITDAYAEAEYQGLGLWS